MQFIHLTYLAAAAATIAIPVWIHLLLRQRARQMQIGSTRFLKAVVRRTKRRQRLRRWLLFSLRCLAVLLLGLLFARPFLPAVPEDGSTRETVVLIDRSASMQSEDENAKSSFERAKVAARQHIAVLGDQARVLVGLFDSGGVQTIEVDELAAAEVGFGGTDYREAFAWARDVLADSSRTDRSLVLYSDLQSTGLAVQPPETFPADVSVEIVDLEPSLAHNLAVEQADPVQIELRPGVPVAVEARIYNADVAPITAAQLTLRLEGPSGQIEQQRFVDLAPGARQSVSFAFELDQPGVYHGGVSIYTEDPLTWDDTRWLALEARRPDRVLLVDGDPGGNEYASETYYLEKALRLQTPIGDAPPRTFEIERIVWDRGDGFPDLSGFRLVVLANPGRFTVADAARLKDYLQQGGNTLLFVGERVTRGVLEPMQAAALLPEANVPAPRDVFGQVTRFDHTHPVLSVFSDVQQGDLRRLHVERLLPLSELFSEQETLLAVDDQPLIAARKVGNGRIVVVGTTADLDWNDWPRGRLYVPLIRQLAAWLTGQLEPQQLIDVQQIAAAGQRPGIVSADGGAITVWNVDAKESEISRLTAEQFRQAMNLPAAARTAAQRRAENLAPAGVARSDELWPWVLWCLLAVLMGETLLASRIVE